jgi:hypothetical protein
VEEWNNGFFEKIWINGMVEKRKDGMLGKWNNGMMNWYMNRKNINSGFNKLKICEKIWFRFSCFAHYSNIPVFHSSNPLFQHSRGGIHDS